MRVDEKIKNIVLQIEGLSYEYNDWTRANVTLDLKTLPVCVYVLPASGQLYNHNGNLRDYPNAMMAFLDKAELDYEGEENEPTVERMKKAAKTFIQRVNSSGMFAPIPETINYRVVYDMLDVNLTGVILELQLKELRGDCINYDCRASTFNSSFNKTFQNNCND
jgi:hypothetical protein